jgi:glycosyltransferase involved in cell wall biosynthesis
MSKSIFYVRPSNSPFVQVDEEILQKHFKVIAVTLNNRTQYRLLISLFWLLFQLIIKVNKYSVIYTRFADYHAGLLTLFSNLFRKKLIIVIGGYDVYHIPELNYGIYTKKIRGKIAKYALENAYMLLPNSKAMIYHNNNYAIYKSVEGGINYFAPKTKAKIQLLYNGFDPEKWPYVKSERKGIISAANINNWLTWKMKGFDLLVEAACYMHSETFTLVGVTQSFRNNLNIVPPNVVFVDFLPNEQLAKYYANHKVFCLLSLAEGMPNVLCEAMLCGCIPVVSDVSPMPEIVESVGYVVQSKKVSLVIDALNTALNTPENTSALSNKKIIDNYSLNIRTQNLIEIMKYSNIN